MNRHIGALIVIVVSPSVLKCTVRNKQAIFVHCYVHHHKYLAHLPCRVIRTKAVQLDCGEYSSCFLPLTELMLLVTVFFYTRSFCRLKIRRFHTKFRIRIGKLYYISLLPYPFAFLISEATNLNLLLIWDFFLFLLNHKFTSQRLCVVIRTKSQLISFPAEPDGESASCHPRILHSKHRCCWTRPSCRYFSQPHLPRQKAG